MLLSFIEKRIALSEPWQFSCLYRNTATNIQMVNTKIQGQSNQIKHNFCAQFLICCSHKNMSEGNL